MRSSPTSSARHLQAIDAGQLALPFLVEPAASMPTTVVDRGDKTKVGHQVRSSTRHPRKKATTPPARLVENSSAPARNPAKRKPPSTANASATEKLLVSRKQAAVMLSISIRGVDYMIADRRLTTRRIANRVLIPVEEIRKFARSDHPERLAG